MKEATLLFVDMLVEDPRNNYLVTAPTTLEMYCTQFFRYGVNT